MFSNRCLTYSELVKLARQKHGDAVNQPSNLRKMIDNKTSKRQSIYSNRSACNQVKSISQENNNLVNFFQSPLHLSSGLRSPLMQRYPSNQLCKDTPVKQFQWSAHHQPSSRKGELAKQQDGLEESLRMTCHSNQPKTHLQPYCHYLEQEYTLQIEHIQKLQLQKQEQGIQLDSNQICTPEAAVSMSQQDHQLQVYQCQLQTLTTVNQRLKQELNSFKSQMKVRSNMDAFTQTYCSVISSSTETEKKAFIETAIETEVKQSAETEIKQSAETKIKQFAETEVKQSAETGTSPQFVTTTDTGTDSTVILFLNGAYSQTQLGQSELSTLLRQQSEVRTRMKAVLEFCERLHACELESSAGSNFGQYLAECIHIHVENLLHPFKCEIDLLKELICKQKADFAEKEVILKQILAKAHTLINHQQLEFKHKMIRAKNCFSESLSQERSCYGVLATFGNI